MHHAASRNRIDTTRDVHMADEAPVVVDVRKVLTT
jgi:hypothetical protein